MAKWKLAALPLAIMAATSVAHADEASDARIEKLEQEIQILKDNDSKSMSDRFKFNGFYSVGVTRASNDLGYAGAQESYDLNNLTKVGLQAEFAMADSTGVTVQLVSKGEDDFEPAIEWAYIKHSFDNDVVVRAGKLRVPLFMYSDYLDVGYAQPWARPPTEVYDFVPFTAYVGGDIAYDYELDNSTLGLQAFGGQYEENGVKYDYMVGANLTYTWEDLTLRAVYGQNKINATIDADPSVIGVLGLNDNTKGQFVGAGFQYDNGQILAVGEYTEVKVDALYPSVKNGYLTLGYRIDAWMPYASYAFAESTDDDVREGSAAALLSGERTTYSLGVRYDLMSNLAVKFDATFTGDFDGSGGLIDGNLPVYPTYEEDQTVYSIVFQGVF
ncbi:hypothetical protein DBZ36_08210 [Alginatibacterium sediminis]|uniref:Porin n=1 Tax=Alginatibacterium sediminis TaxID=2164068 RepID=A0A420EI55_9ALTE|nr:hypothetical protein [Alginatibacterium sediminis]RKF20411.1 hypothetical protein DBZ36_08210 [Alginatibacterium sediminis]